MVASGLWSVRLRCEVFLSFFELYCRHHVKMVNYKQICVLKLNLVNWERKKFNQKKRWKGDCSYTNFGLFDITLLVLVWNFI